MAESKREAINLLLLLLILAGVAVGDFQTYRVVGHLAALASSENPMTFVITWASGNTTAVYTPRRDGESIESLTERHNEEVAYVKAHPPIGESLPP